MNGLENMIDKVFSFVGKGYGSEGSKPVDYGCRGLYRSTGGIKRAWNIRVFGLVARPGYRDGPSERCKGDECSRNLARCV